LTRAITILRFALFANLGGCAVVPDVVLESMADPAKYDLYDCKQLQAARSSLAAQAAELEGLIAKAETGVGGSMAAEVAYRPDLAKIKASARLANRVWERDKCTATTQPPPPSVPSLSPKTQQGGSRGAGSFILSPTLARCRIECKQDTKPMLVSFTQAAWHRLA
jgi:hypothetical protein